MVWGYYFFISPVPYLFCFLLPENDFLQHPVSTHWLIAGDHMTSVVEDHIVHTTFRMVSSNMTVHTRNLDRSHVCGCHLGVLKTLVTLPGHETQGSLGQSMRNHSIQQSSVQSNLQSLIDQITNEILGDDRGITTILVNALTIVGTTLAEGNVGRTDVDQVLDSGELRERTKERGVSTRKQRVAIEIQTDNKARSMGRKFTLR
jgi:hypothetical protein